MFYIMIEKKTLFCHFCIGYFDAWVKKVFKYGLLTRVSYFRL